MPRIRRYQVPVAARHHRTRLNGPTLRRRSLFIVLGTGLALSLVGVAMGGGAPAASAQRPVGLERVSADPFTNSTSQHRTEVEPDTFHHGSTVVGAFQGGRQFVGAASDIGWVTSHNGGQRFTAGFLPGITQFAGGSFIAVGDPSVAYDAAHRVWLISSIAGTDQPSPHPAAVLVSRSRDGLHWEPPVTVATGAFVDKNWTACDNSPRSPFYGHCYTEYDSVAEGFRIKMSTSTDGGVSWSAPAETANLDAGQAGQPVVQPNGTVIVPITNTFFSSVASFRSTDGGQSWSATAPVGAISRHPVAGGLRAPVFPSAEVDRDGTVYAAWQDCRFRVGCSANDIVLTTTTDGVDWSPVARIPIDPLDSGADHFIPGLAVDPTSSGDHARLALTYYSYPDADCTAATCRLTVGFVSSRDGGASWSAPTELAGPMQLDWLADTSQGRMVGDYISTSFIGGRALPLFADAGPPSGGLFDEAMATIRGGLPVGAPPAP